MRSDEPLLCCETSLAADEPMIGTAPQVRYWFLLQYDGAWGYDAFAESNLSLAVKAKLEVAANALAPAKILFIRQPRRQVMSKRFVLVDAERGLYQSHELRHYEDLLDIDLIEMAQHLQESEPLYLVCVNGKRDTACSKYGQPVFQSLQQVVGEAAWQCSHLGGHRFAATGVVLPNGIVYGRLTPDAVDSFSHHHARGELDTASLRGRSLLPGPAQAAEAFLRAEQGADKAVDAYRLDAISETEGGWLVSLRDRANACHQLRVWQEPWHKAVLKSTGDPETQHLPAFHVAWAEEE